MTTLKESIAEKISRYGDMTFAGLANIKGVSGDISHYISNEAMNFEVLIWPGMSMEATDAINELLDQKVIAITDCSPLVYFMDGAVPNVPVLTKEASRRKTPYKKPRTYWAPMLIQPFADVKPKHRLPLRLRAPIDQHQSS